METNTIGSSELFEAQEFGYHDKQEHKSLLSIIPKQKINVFISSKCDENGKYACVRESIKKLLKLQTLQRCTYLKRKIHQLYLREFIILLRWKTVMFVFF